MANRIFPDPEGSYSFVAGIGNAPDLHVRFNPVTHSLRVQADAARRLFFLESSPPRLLLHNEYGLRVGHCRFDDGRSLGGSLELDGCRFTFAVSPGSLTLQPAGGTPLVFPVDAPLPPHAEPFAALLFALCWEVLHQETSRPASRP